MASVTILDRQYSQNNSHRVCILKKTRYFFSVSNLPLQSSLILGDFICFYFDESDGCSTIIPKACTGFCSKRNAGIYRTMRRRKSDHTGFDNNRPDLRERRDRPTIGTTLEGAIQSFGYHVPIMVHHAGAIPSHPVSRKPSMNWVSHVLNRRDQPIRWAANLS